MSLRTLDSLPINAGAQPTTDAVVAPSASSMRFMETGLAFVSILVALLLSLAR